MLGPEFDGREVYAGAGRAGGQNLTVKRSVVEQGVLEVRLSFGQGPRFEDGGRGPLPPSPQNSSFSYVGLG